MLLSPDPAGHGGAGLQRAQRTRPVLGRGGGAVAYNLVIIGCAVVLGPFLGIEGLAIGGRPGLAGAPRRPIALDRPHAGLPLSPHSRRARSGDPRGGPPDGAPRARPGRDPDHFLVNTSLASTLATARSWPTTWPSPSCRSPSASSASRWASSCCPRCRGPWRWATAASTLRLIVRSLRLLLYVMLFLTAMTIVLGSRS